MQKPPPFLRKYLVLLLITGFPVLAAGCGCGEGPPFSVTFSPGAAELGPGESATVQAKLMEGSKPGPVANWSTYVPSNSAKLSEVLASWSLSPTFGVNETAIRLVAQPAPSIDGNFFLGNADAVRLWVSAEHGIRVEEYGTSAGADLPITVYELKLGEVHRSIKPTYVKVEGTLGTQRLVRMETDCVIEILYDTTGARYTFEAQARQDRFRVIRNQGGGSTMWVRVGQVSDLTLTAANDGRSARVRMTADFSGIVHGPGETTAAGNLILEVTARRADGRVVKGIFQFYKDSNCVLC